MAWAPNSTEPFSRISILYYTYLDLHDYVHKECLDLGQKGCGQFSYFCFCCCLDFSLAMHAAFNQPGLTLLPEPCLSYRFSPSLLISEAANLPDFSPSFRMIFSPPSRDVWSDHDALGSGNADMVLKMVSGSPTTPSTAPVSERSKSQ